MHIAHAHMIGTSHRLQHYDNIIEDSWFFFFSSVKITAFDHLDIKQKLIWYCGSVRFSALKQLERIYNLIANKTVFACGIQSGLMWWLWVLFCFVWIIRSCFFHRGSGMNEKRTNVSEEKRFFFLHFTNEMFHVTKAIHQEKSWKNGPFEQKSW